MKDTNKNMTNEEYHKFIEQSKKYRVYNIISSLIFMALVILLYYLGKKYENINPMVKLLITVVQVAVLGGSLVRYYKLNKAAKKFKGKKKGF